MWHQTPVFCHHLGVWCSLLAGASACLLLVAAAPSAHCRNGKRYERWTWLGKPSAKSHSRYCSGLPPVRGCYEAPCRHSQQLSWRSQPTSNWWGHLWILAWLPVRSQPSTPAVRRGPWRHKGRAGGARTPWCTGAQWARASAAPASAVPTSSRIGCAEHAGSAAPGPLVPGTCSQLPHWACCCFSWRPYPQWERYRKARWPGCRWCWAGFSGKHICSLPGWIAAGTQMKTMPRTPSPAQRCHSTSVSIHPGGKRSGKHRKGGRKRFSQGANQRNREWQFSKESTMWNWYKLWGAKVKSSLLRAAGTDN